MVDDDKKWTINVEGMILPPLFIGVFLWGLFDLAHRAYTLIHG